MRTIRALQAAGWRLDTVEQIAERFDYARAKARLDQERAERYPAITAENVEEVLAWQERRLSELRAEEAK